MSAFIFAEKLGRVFEPAASFPVLKVIDAQRWPFVTFAKPTGTLYTLGLSVAVWILARSVLCEGSSSAMSEAKAKLPAWEVERWNRTLVYLDMATEAMEGRRPMGKLS